MVDSRPQVEDDACLVASEQAVEMLAQARGGVTEAQLAVEVEDLDAQGLSVGAVDAAVVEGDVVRAEELPGVDPRASP